MEKQEKEEISQRTTQIILSKIVKFILYFAILWFIFNFWSQILFVFATPTFFLLNTLKIDLNFTKSALLDLVIFIIVCIFVDLMIIGVIYGVCEDFKEGKKLIRVYFKLMRLTHLTVEQKSTISREIANELNFPQILYELIDTIHSFPAWYENTKKWHSAVIHQSDLKYLKYKEAKHFFQDLELEYFENNQELLELKFKAGEDAYTLLTTANSVFDFDAPTVQDFEESEEGTYFITDYSFPVIILKNDKDIVLKAKLFKGTQIYTEHPGDFDYFRNAKIEFIEAGKWMLKIKNLLANVKEDEQNRVQKS